MQIPFHADEHKGVSSPYPRRPTVYFTVPNSLPEMWLACKSKAIPKQVCLASISIYLFKSTVVMQAAEMAL